MNAHGLTPRQTECLSFIGQEIDAGRPTPSYSQIAEYLGLKSKSSVAQLIGELEARGHITRIRRCRRSIALVKTKCPRCGYLMSASRQTNSSAEPGSGRGDSLTASGSQTTGDHWR